MEKNEKRIKRVCWTILILGSAALGAGQATFNLSNFILIAWLSIVALGSMTLNLLWYREISQKLNKINLILNEQCDPDQYIAELNALMEGKRSFQLRQIHLINLGAAYIQKEDYEKAKSLLLQVKPSRIGKINKVIYWADLALAYFYLKEEQLACAIMEAQKNNFQQFKDDKQVGETLAILAIFQLLTTGEKEKAKQQLAEARKQWESPRSMNDFAHLESLINM